MESDLIAYRRRKRQKEILEQIKCKIWNMVPQFQFKTENQTTEPEKEATYIQAEFTNECDCDYENESEISESNSANVDDGGGTTEQDKSQKSDWIAYAIRFVSFLLWATCFLVAIELKFGIVYLLFSALFGIYFNTRTKPKKHGEISAYSVFNKGCRSIDGALTAEQFEQELRYGSHSVR